MDGLNDYLHDPFQWAVDVIFEQITDVHRCSNAGIHALVESSYDFIEQSFSDLELSPPSQEALTSKVIEQVESQKYARLASTSPSK